MSSYQLSNEAKDDLIRIHQYGLKKFGVRQADKYFNAFFKCFNTIAERPFSFEPVSYIKTGYRRCVCGSDSIYFRINDKQIDIMAIVGQQDLESLL